MTDPMVAIVSPVFTVGGTLNRDLGRDCVRLEVEETIEGLRTLRADFVAIGPGASGPPDPMLYLDGQAIDFGHHLKVSVGPESAERIVFDGVVSGLELVLADSEPPRLVVFAEDALMRLRMTRRMRTYTQRHRRRHRGAAGDASTACSATPRWRARGTTSCSSSTRATSRFCASVPGSCRASCGAPSGRSTSGPGPNRRGSRLTLVQGNDLLATRLTADLAHQRSEVVVTGYDAAAKSVVEQRAGKEAIQAEVSGGRTGPQVVKLALEGSTSFRVREVALTAEEASAWAKAEMLRRARGFVTVSGLTRGSPDMVVGSILTLQLVGAPFEGDGYYVTKVCHTFDHVQGLRTRFEAERTDRERGGVVTRPTVVDGSAPGYFGVYPALVTKLVADASEKPQPMPGQVQVKFPWLGQDADAAVRAWATLCSPYADDDQGLEILPEVGSEVVVAFEGGNLRRPYIIGAAWHGKAALPNDAVAANNIRVLKSRGKSRLEFDDTQGHAEGDPEHPRWSHGDPGRREA